MNGRPWKSGAKEREIALALTIAASLFLFPSLLRMVLPRTYALAAASAIALWAVALSFPSEVYGMRKLSLSDAAWSLAAVIPIQLGVGIATLLWGKVLKLLHIECATTQPAAQWITQSGFSVELFLLFLVFCIASPVIEEVLFRRLIYGRLVPCGKVAAIVTASLLFAVSHFFLYGAPGLLVMGVGFQLLFLKRENLAVSMLAHSAVNLCALIGVLWMR